MSYQYKIYGLCVQSDIEINEAMTIDKDKQEPDVVVTVASMPEEVLQVQQERDQSQVAIMRKTGAMYFRIPDVAEYLVEESQITVTPIAAANSQEVKTFLLGSAFGYCMVLRKMVVMHGGAIALDNQGIIITGDSGAGKSTVTNALREQGYQFIADDVCALDIQEKETHINMAYPQQKLCRNAALEMGYDLSELIYINESRDKFAVRLKDGYLPEGAPFRYLFELTLSEEDSDSVSCSKIEGHEKLFAILRNIYRGESAFELWGMPPEYMKKCLQIASTVEVYRISRPKEKDTLKEIIELVTNKIV